MKIVDAKALIENLRRLPRETEWVEFKLNRFNEEDVAQYVSGLANSAILKGEARAFLLFGIEDQTHEIAGTDVRLKEKKVGNEPFENWLNRCIEPRLNLEFVSVDFDGKIVELIAIDPAYQQPVRFTSSVFPRG